MALPKFKLKFKQAKERSIGIDVGSHSIKWIEIEKQKKGAKITQTQIISAWGGLGQALKEVFKEEAAIPRKISISLSGSSILTRKLSLPMMSPQELKAAITFEAEKHMPFSIQDCYLDTQILVEDPEKKTMDILLAAAKKEFIEDHLKAFNEFGILPDVIDVGIFCVWNTLETFLQTPPPKLSALIDIGHTGTTLLLMQDGSPNTVRDIPYGGVEVTRYIAQAKNMSESDAEKFKHEKTSENLSELADACQHGFENLIEQIRQSIGFFEGQAGGEIEGLWISGGGSLAEGTLKVFQDAFGKKVHLWNAVTSSGYKIAKDEEILQLEGNRYNAALGAAMRRF